MKATHISSHRSVNRATPTYREPVDHFERSLGLLAAAGFSFEVVERCPTPCALCDGNAVRAA